MLKALLHAATGLRLPLIHRSRPCRKDDFVQRSEAGSRLGQPRRRIRSDRSVTLELRQTVSLRVLAAIGQHLRQRDGRPCWQIESRRRRGSSLENGKLLLAVKDASSSTACSRLGSSNFELQIRERFVSVPTRSRVDGSEPHERASKADAPKMKREIMNQKSRCSRGRA